MPSNIHKRIIRKDLTQKDKHMRRIFRTIAAVAFVAVMTSCNGTNLAKFFKETPDWEVETVDAITAATGMATPAISFSDGRINGHTGCNSFFADMKLEKDGKVLFENIGSTKMFCPDMMEQEDAILMALQKATYMEKTNKGKSVVLKDNDGNILMTLRIKADDKE